MLPNHHITNPKHHLTVRECQKLNVTCSLVVLARLGNHEGYMQAIRSNTSSLVNLCLYIPSTTLYKAHLVTSVENSRSNTPLSKFREVSWSIKGQTVCQAYEEFEASSSTIISHSWTFGRSCVKPRCPFAPARSIHTFLPHHFR